jgi:hypothetical protein
MLKKLVLTAAAVAFVGWASSASAQNHLACYQMKDLKNPAKFDNTGSYSLSNQVQMSDTATKCKVKLLCVITDKDANTGGTVDDYICYQCKGSKGGPSFQVTDQFGTVSVETKKLKFLCNPLLQKTPL